MIKGSKHTQETKLKLSLSNKGKQAWNKGMPRHWKSTGEFQKGDAPWNKGFKWERMTREKHPSWKGGRGLSTQGYMNILINGKRILEHRHVMEEHIGRKLHTKEHVHHINGIKTDNRIENLKLMNTSEHNSFHATKQWENGGFKKHLH